MEAGRSEPGIRTRRATVQAKGELAAKSGLAEGRVVTTQGLPNQIAAIEHSNAARQDQSTLLVSDCG